MNSTSKTVLITGASRGIGRASAKAFAIDGWNVAVHYNKNEASAHILVDELRKITDAECFSADISDSQAVRNLVKAVTIRFKHIDAVINNAGIAQQKLFTELSDEDWRNIFSVNTDSVFYVCREVLPQMLARHNGAIVNVSSVWGINGASCEVHYSASKAAVIGLTKALAKEMGTSGIRVNCVAPGVIDTDMNSDFDERTMEELRNETPLERIGTPKEVANLICYLCSDKASFVTGQIISVDGGFGL